MAASGIPGLDVNDPFNPGNRQVPTGGSPQAASWRSERMANMGPQALPGGTALQPDKTMRWAQSVQQGAAKFAEGPRPNGITEGARGMATGIRDASAAGTRVGVDVAKGVARRVPLGGIAGVASEVLPHSGVYSGAGDMPWQDRLAVGATDLLAAGGGALGGMVGAGVGQVALPIPGVGAVAGGLTGGIAGAKAGRWLGDKMFSSGDALQRAGFDPDRGIVDIGRDVAGGKSLEDAMSPTMRAPIAPQQPAMPGQRGIGAVEGSRGESPNSFGDGASGGFQTVPTWRNTGAAPTAPATFAGNAGGTFDNTQKFTPNQVAPTGPNLTGRAPETFAEGSDRGGGSVSAPMAPAVPSALPPGESQTAAASFRANPQGQPGIGPPPPIMPAERANFLAGGGNGSPYQAGSDAGGGPNRKLPRDLSSLAPGQVYKTIDPATGRTVYSGRDVRENANIVDAGGAKTGQLSNNLRGEGIQVLDGQGRVTDTRTPSSGFGQSGGFRANQPDNVPWPDMHIPSFADRHQSVVNGADGRALSGWAPGMEGAMRRYGGAGDDRPNNLSPEQNRNVNELAGRFKAGEFSGGGAGDPPAGLRGRKADRANAFAMASMREQGENLRSQRQTDAIMRGHIMTNNTAGIRLGYDMRRDKRDYDTGRADVGFTQGQQAIKDLHQEIGGMLPPTRDDKGNPTPDTQNAARYATAIQATVGRLGGTMKDLTAPDKARFVAGMQLADVANATATNGLTPWGTRAIQSNEPILAIKRLANGDYQTNRVGVNGETEVIPKHYVEKEGSFMSFGGRATNKFKALMEASNGAAR